LKNNCTTSTFTFRVSVDESPASFEGGLGAESVFDVGPVDDVTGGGGGGGSGIPWAIAAPDNDIMRARVANPRRLAARKDLHCNVSI
jgi:hypothetical protein